MGNVLIGFYLYENNESSQEVYIWAFKITTSNASLMSLLEDCPTGAGASVGERRPERSGHL